MRIALVVIALIVIAIVIAVLIVGIAILLQRRSSRRAAERFGNADELIRRWGDDARPTRRLQQLADDRRTPSSARRHLDRLVRYRRSPIVLAPDWVPVLGWFNEVTIESYLLNQAWKSLPLELWAEYFPSTVASRPTAKRPTGATQPPSAEQQPRTLSARLAELDSAGQHPELLRLLDRSLPAWPISGALIEVAREIVELERNVATARQSSVPAAVTTRLGDESRTAAAALWDLADRLTAAAAYGIESDRMTERLDLENAKLVELRAAIRDARTGLAELTLSGGARTGEVDRAERRFRALAQTAAELQELDRV